MMVTTHGYEFPYMTLIQWAKIQINHIFVINCKYKDNSPYSIQRSALTYNDDFNILRRNIGISTASTTSRSTCKTSSSPYSRGERAAAGPRGVGASSSTPSNYNSNTDLNSQSVKSPYAYNDSTTFHRKHSEFRLICTIPLLLYNWN